MFVRGIRGATTVENDTVDDIKNSTIELFGEIIKQNNVEIENISHVLFTMTKDIKSAFPARFVRENFEAQFLPMMCVNELDIEPSLCKCIRVLVVVNTDKKQNEIVPIYLKGAKVLRPDLAK